MDFFEEAIREAEASAPKSKRKVKELEPLEGLPEEWNQLLKDQDQERKARAAQIKGKAPKTGRKVGKGFSRVLPKNSRDPEHKVTLRGLGVNAVRLTQDEVTAQGLNSSEEFTEPDEGENYTGWNKANPVKKCGQIHKGECHHHPEYSPTTYKQSPLK